MGRRSAPFRVYSPFAPDISNAAAHLPHHCFISPLTARTACGRGRVAS